MNDFSLQELNTLLIVFAKAGIQQGEASPEELDLLSRLQQAQVERDELENMDFDDCLGGACKL
ncbi:hypothetical protein [Aliamphritea spongicola]|uniref:hypothetical protein n=1 Tax=Aliamphritea spongicola TaxID=707589 RepID=UPI00196B8494|nr:hypothetical protein [Aliamphritea spongicola]MBN3564023.1 hypothetical protein [Aliamphritea spongicola]